MRYGYSLDGLISNHSCGFMDEPAFMKAYERGCKSMDICKFPLRDYQWYWRVHIGLWCAKNCVSIQGDFVECGVASGFLSSAICDFLNWNSLDKKFYLFDTFNGQVSNQLLQEEKELKISHVKKIYDDIDFNDVVANFSEWKNIELIKGAIPDTLSQIKAEKVSFLHLDLNCAYPEEQAFRHLHSKLVKGSHVLLDDYGHTDFYPQKIMWDKLAAEFNFNILSLPTGQGLIIF